MGGFQLRRKARLGLLKSNPCSNVKDKRVLQKHKNYCDDSPGDGRYQAVCHDVRGGKERLTIVIFTSLAVANCSHHPLHDHGYDHDQDIDHGQDIDHDHNHV